MTIIDPAPLLEVARRFSPRSWLLLFLGPTYFGLAFRYLSIAPSTAPWLFLPLMVIIAGSFVADRRPALRWGAALTVAALCWVLLLLAVNIAQTPKNQYHDEILLTEAALNGFVHGKNPYAMDFRGTLVDTWVGHPNRSGYVRGVYPGWDHYVYLPMVLLVSLPTYVILTSTAGWYDQRLVYALIYAGLMIVAWKALRGSRVREPLMLAFFLNPFFSTMFIGFNDVVMIAMLLAAGLSLRWNKPMLTATLYGAALMTKQGAWLTLPFFLPILAKEARRSYRSPLALWAVAGGMAAVVALPFFLSSPSRFLDDTVKLFVGTQYPITGDGFSSLLLRLGVVRPEDPYPFWLFEIIFALPIVLLTQRWFRRSPDAQHALAASAVALASVWFFSRYFLPHHASVIVLLLIGSFLVGEAERLRSPV